MRHVYYWTQNAPFYKLNFKNLYAMGWDGMEWDAMGWDGMGWDGRFRALISNSTPEEIN